MAQIRSLFFEGPLTELREKTIEAYEKGRPSTVTWNVTNKCNLLCKHCYVAATHKKKANELTHEEAMDLVEQIGKLEVPLLFLTGGEPFMRPDLFEIIARARELGTRVVMSSNATFIGDEIADKLAGFDVDYVGVSLYGPEEFHDEYVMVPGTFKKVVAAVGRLRERGIRVGIKTTVNAETYPYFRQIVEVAKELGASLLYPCDLISTGRAEELYSQRITAEQWREIADFILADVLEDEDGIEYDIGAQPSIIPYMARRLKQEQGDYDIHGAMRRVKIKGACPVGRGLMTVNSEGEIMPCSFVQEYSLGNIREISLQKGVKRLFELGRAKSMGRCGSCKFTNVCRGCRAKAYLSSKNILGEDPLCMMAMAEEKA